MGQLYRGLIERYRKFLPVNEKTPVITLREGNTPLISIARFAREIGFGGDLYVKYEGLNPTGSFKDRGMTVAVSKAVEEKSRVIICASTGNTAASAAAYAARAGISCVVLIPKGAIALGKLSQALIHGARVLEIEGNFDEALKIVVNLSKNYPITMVNSLNPYRLQGQKTAAFEIIDTLGRAPDYQFMPVGNAGNITAYWMGYKEYAEYWKKEGKYIARPKMMGFQAEGAAPIVRKQIVVHPRTIATAIRIGNPASWKFAEIARDESGGVIDAVSDQEIIEAYQLLAQSEGIFVEPASAASLAGLKKYVQQKKIIGQPLVVAILTGHGLKDPDTAIKSVGQSITVPADEKAIARILNL